MPGRTTPAPVVMKFGGTSVEDGAAFRRVVDIVAAADAPTAVVTSAMSKVTDGLVGSFRRAGQGDLDEALTGVEGLLDRYRAAAGELLSGHEGTALRAEVDDAHRRVAPLLEVVRSHPGTRPALHDEIVSWGERLASSLLAAALRAGGIDAVAVDARRCIRTDEAYTRATPLAEPTDRSSREELEPHLAAGRVPVLGGFIASGPSGGTTTLGRGGSDYTAALVGAALRAREVQIWTDVSGFLTADPRVVPGARTIPRLSHDEAAELAFFGAKVLHPKTIQPAVERGIPVLVRNSRAPGAGETRIDGAAGEHPRGVKAIAHKTGVTVVQVTAARMLGAYGFLRALFEIFDRHRTSVDIVTTSEVSVSLTVDDTERLPDILPELEALGTARVEPEPQAIVCVVGEGLRDTPGVAARVFGTVRDFNITLISQGASSINLTFVVKADDAPEAVRRLHGAFFEGG